MSSTIKYFTFVMFLLIGMTLVAATPAFAVAITFEDLRRGKTFCTRCDEAFPPVVLVAPIYTAGRRLELTQFSPIQPVGPGDVIHGAIATVQRDRRDEDNSSLGKYLDVDDGVLELDIRNSTERLTLDFRVDAARHNRFRININGRFVQTNDLLKLNGRTIRGVSIGIRHPSIHTPLLAGWHRLVLNGGLDSFSIGGNQFSIDNIRYRDRRTAVPEPTSMLLLGAGLLGMRIRRKR